MESRGLKGGHYLEKMTKIVADQPQIYWSSASQPCDRITGVIVACMARNSLRYLAKTARKESDHRDFALRSKIERGQDYMGLRP